MVTFRYLEGKPVALVSCKECGQQISDQASSCPRCGYTKPAATGKLLLSRKAQRVNGSRIVVDIYIDGLLQGHLRVGEQLEYDMLEGDYQLVFSPGPLNPDVVCTARIRANQTEQFHLEMGMLGLKVS